MCQWNFNRCFQSGVIELRVEIHEGLFFSTMIPMASIPCQFVPTSHRYKMPPTEFESLLPVRSYRVEGRGT